MRVSVCELPDDLAAFRAAWADIENRLARSPVDLLVLPELAGVESFWRLPAFDAVVWQRALAQQAWLLERLPLLAAQCVIGTLVEQRGEQRLNVAFVHTRDGGLVHGRAKAWLPDEDGTWEATWFHRGDSQVPVQESAGLRHATLICTELMVSGTPRALGRAGTQLIAVPRATGGHLRWGVATRMAALSAGAYLLSANRQGGGLAGGSSIVDPEGEELARTNADHPLIALDIDQCIADNAKRTYPRNVVDPVDHGVSPEIARPLLSESA
jgi:N-carbamoylputrescine amidase